MLATKEIDPEIQLAISEERDKRSAIELLSAYNHTQGLIARTKGLALDSCEAAMRCGALFNAKKEEVGHGKWLKWLETYLPEVSARTVQNWMRVAANKRNVADLNGEPKSLRQTLAALQATFADPVSAQQERALNQSTPPRMEPARQNCFSPFDRLFAEKPVEALLAKPNFLDWDIPELNLGLRKLEPITIVRNKMEHALQVKLGAR